MLHTGPFSFQIRTDVSRIIHGIHLLYRDFTAERSRDFTDFHMRFITFRGRHLRSRVNFVFDGQVPFQPLPADQALAMFEWCFNWCISNCVNQYLVIHAAAVERNGAAAILPGPPGSGKSTLCAALVNRGWRLLTDELVLISLETARIIPLARPIGLKNASIELIREFAPAAVLAPECKDTLKGRVAHLRPPTESVLRIDEPAVPAWLVFPKYSLSQPVSSSKLSKAQALMQCAASAFNYTVLGVQGFEVLAKTVDRIEPYALQYRSLNAAVDWFDALPLPAAHVDTALPLA